MVSNHDIGLHAKPSSGVCKSAAQLSSSATLCGAGGRMTFPPNPTAHHATDCCCKHTPCTGHKMSLVHLDVVKELADVLHKGRRLGRHAKCFAVLARAVAP